MSGSGFHWFVAWRYLMARPRRVSPAVFLVAGVLCVVSIAASLIGNLVFRASSPRAFVSIGGQELLQVLTLVLLAQAGLHVVWGLFGHARRYPGRFGVPCLGLGALIAAAVGALAHAGEGLTHDVGVFLLILSAPLMLAAGIGYARGHRAAAASTLVSAALLAAAGYTTWIVGRELFGAGSGPQAPALVAGLGLWVLALAAVELVITGQSLRGRASGGAIVAALLLAACAVLVQVAGGAGGAGGAGAPPELPLDELAAHVPAMDEPLAYADGLFLAGLGLLGLGVILFLAGSMLRLVQHLRGETRGMVGLLKLAVACGTAGGLLAVAVLLLRADAEAYFLFSARQRPEQPFLLAAVALLALAELTVLLLAIRYVFTFFTTVSVAGVTIGSMALVIVLSVMSGFEIDLRDKILGSNAHVLITKDEGAFTEYREVAERIAGIPGVLAQTPYLTSEVVLAASSNYANVIIKGVDPETVGEVTDLARNTRQPRALERLYPLAEDGGVLGPPRDAGVPEEAAPPAEGAADGEAVDPPPPDMDTGWAAPRDFSGGAMPGEDAPAEPDAGAAPAEDAPGATTQGGVDPPPPDMDLGWDAPWDFSGGVSGPQGTDDSAEIDTGPVDMADPIFNLPEGLTGAPSAPGSAPGARLDDDWPGARWDDSLDTEPAAPRVRVPARVARLPGVLVGKELVKNLHLYVGQEVRIISPLTEDTPAGPVPRTRYLRVAGTFFTGMYEYDFKFVYVALSTLQTFLDLEDEVSGIEIRVEDPMETGPVLEDIRAALPPGFRVQDWQEINRNLFSALKLEKIAMFLVLAIIILVASFSIISNLIMVVVEKAKEIALLKTLGATDGGVVRVFVAQGLFIGLVGTVVGVAHGLLACFLGNLYGLPLDPEVYYIDRLPIHVEGLAVAAVGVAGVAISVVATLYPAVMAAQLQPMEGLRYD